NTVLGQAFSINSLTFTPDDTGPVVIGGANTLTLGTGGITDNASNVAALNVISAPVALGAAQTWTNNTANNLSGTGVISGAPANNLTFGGSGSFTFTNTNTYTGATSLSSLGSTLNLSGANGSLATSTIALEGGTTLNVDNTAANNTDRIGDAVGISSKGATIALKGPAATETVGTLTLPTGLTRVNVDAGSTLTFGSVALPGFARSAGATVNFSAGGTTKVPNVTLTNGIIGGWATVGNVDSNAPSNALDFAAVDGSNNIVPLATYSLNDFSASTNNTKVDGSAGTGGRVSLAAGITTINSLYMTGTGGISFNGSGSTNTLVIGAGGILANGTTQTLGSSNQPDLTNAAVIGNGNVNPTNTDGNNVGGTNGQTQQ